MIIKSFKSQLIIQLLKSLFTYKNKVNIKSEQIYFPIIRLFVYFQEC